MLQALPLKKRLKMNFNKLDQTFIIAEIGVNHEGDFDVAAELVRNAASKGADAVKFQTFSIEHYISKEQPERYERTKGFQLSEEQFSRLAEIAKEEGVMFFSTPFGLGNVDFLDRIAPIFKVSSGDLTFLPLIRHVASKRKPMIISTGLGSPEEIREAVKAVESVWPTVREDGGLMLMHCVSNYPTEPHNANLRNLFWLKDEFNYPIGYSDHTLGTKACELAVAAGACAVEKHFTYRNTDQTFHDHLLSANPDDLGVLVENIRQAESYLGQYQRVGGQENDAQMEQHMRRSIGLLRDVPAGQPVTAEDLTWLRPAWGLRGELSEVVGQKLNKDLKAGMLIRKEDLA